MVMTSEEWPKCGKPGSVREGIEDLPVRVGCILSCYHGTTELLQRLLDWKEEASQPWTVMMWKSRIQGKAEREGGVPAK